MKNFINLLIVSLLATILFSCAYEKNIVKGEFLDDLILKDLKDGRSFTLVKQFRYLDPQNTLWVVPVDEIVDGASIPRGLWSIVGGPWEGVYRRSSVIHDYFFRTKKYNSDEVHRVFYDAMLTEGVSLLKAKAMYFAVLKYNGEWQQQAFVPCADQIEPGRNVAGMRCLPVADPDNLPHKWVLNKVPFDEEEFKRAAKIIEDRNLSPEEIEEMAKNLESFLP